MLRIGIDVGSTTAKLAVTDAAGKILFSRYERHNAKAKEAVSNLLKEVLAELGDRDSHTPTAFP